MNAIDVEMLESEQNCPEPPGVPGSLKVNVGELGHSAAFTRL